MELWEFSWITGGNAKWYNDFGRQLYGFYQGKHTHDI